MTFEQIINKVLIRLREAQIASSADTEYSALIGEFVNETKREMEDAHNWTILRNTVTIPSVQGTTAYSLTGAGKRSVLFDVYETTTEQWLPRGNAIRLKAVIEQGDEEQPSAYFMEGVDSSGDVIVNLSATPDAVYSYNFHLKTPQAELVDGVDSVMDFWPIILGSYAKAIEERGEDQGTAQSRAMQKYSSAVADVIALDIALTKDEDTWGIGPDRSNWNV